MRPAVRDAFRAYSEPLEGVTTWLYLDVKGLVTVGMGNLVDPISAALGLPFVHGGGTRATQGEIINAWHDVKARQDLALRGGGHFRSLTTIRLTDEGVNDLVATKLDANDRHLRARFGAEVWDAMPADAQLAVHSLAWACGPAFRFPRMAAALAVGDFDLAALECSIHPEIGTIVERNRRQRMCLRNAARVVRGGLDRARLYWPRDLALSEAETLPELPEPRSSGPVLEADGGLSRESATSQAIAEAAHNEITRRHS